MEGISFCPAGHSEMLKSAKGWQEGDLVPPGSSKSHFELQFGSLLLFPHP